jgi:2-keto-4-pentenoate hydratase/2-oxohepta-3-ene-1,7-dioic acid hydratase in catechol pathway
LPTEASTCGVRACRPHASRQAFTSIGATSTGASRHIVIGKTARYVSSEDACDYILSYTCANDVSARDLQRGDPHPTRNKGFDTFCPVGPWMETDLDPVGGVRLRCNVNGAPRQDASTADMTYDIPFLVEYLTGFATLYPGDLTLTGSPGGTEPLHPGDQIEIEIDGIGTLTNGVVVSSERS